MIEEVLPNLFRIEVPLPGNPLKAINSYVIKGAGQFLVVDTGMKREECIKVISSGLSELGVDLRMTDFFITHMHADHSGLVGNLVTSTSQVYMGSADMELVASFNPGYWDEQSIFARRHGFPEDELQRAIKSHPGYKYQSTGRVNFHIVRDDDAIGIGDYLFRCVETPGHTEGHVCLYEPDKKLFISGDHVLIDITPNIALWSDREDPLQDYLISLDKVYGLDVSLVLPGHRSISSNFKGRIEELKHHHETRANEVLAILKGGSQSAFRIAAQMTWDMQYESWELFPVSQKWFATGEALAHLRYLEGKGKVQREVLGQNIVFSLKL